MISESGERNGMFNESENQQVLRKGQMNSVNQVRGHVQVFEARHSHKEPPQAGDGDPHEQVDILVPMHLSAVNTHRNQTLS